MGRIARCPHRRHDRHSLAEIRHDRDDADHLAAGVDHRSAAVAAVQQASIWNMFSKTRRTLPAPRWH
jgi:hypothetical protein